MSNCEIYFLTISEFIMSPSKGSCKFKRRNFAETEEVLGTNQISEFGREEAIPVSHYVERGRKKFDWSKAFEDMKKKMDASSTGIRFRHTSKSDTSSDSEEEDELETKLNAIKLLEKNVVDDTLSEKDDVLEPVWQESKNGPKLPSRKKENDKDECVAENTWGSGSPPDPSCGSLLRFVEQFEKEAAKEQEEVVKFVNGCVVRVKKNRRKRR